MKKVTIVALVLICIGLFTSIIAFGFGYKSDDWDKTEKEDFSVDVSEKENSGEIEEINNLNIDVNVCTLKIVKGDTLKLDVENAIKDSMKTTYDNSTLTIEQKDTQKVKFFGKSFNWNPTHFKNKTKVTLYVPSDKEFDTVTLKNNVSDVTVDFINAEKFTVNANVGDVTIDNLKCNIADLTTQVGDLDIKNAHVKDVTINSDVGDVDFRGTISEKCRIDSDVGDVDMTLDGKQSDYCFSGSSDVGKIKVNGEKISNLCDNNGDIRINIDSDVGDVDINIK